MDTKVNVKVALQYHTAMLIVKGQGGSHNTPVKVTRKAPKNHERTTTTFRAGKHTIEHNGGVSRNEQYRPEAEYGQVREWWSGPPYYCYVRSKGECNRVKFTYG